MMWTCANCGKPSDFNTLCDECDAVFCPKLVRSTKLGYTQYTRCNRKRDKPGQLCTFHMKRRDALYAKRQAQIKEMRARIEQDVDYKAKVTRLSAELGIELAPATNPLRFTTLHNDESAYVHDRVSVRIEDFQALWRQAQARPIIPT